MEVLISALCDGVTICFEVVIINCPKTCKKLFLTKQNDLVYPKVGLLNRPKHDSTDTQIPHSPKKGETS